MKRADPDRRAWRNGFHPLAHLARRFVREGDGQDAAGPNSLSEQISDATRDDPGFAAAGAGEDQKRAFDVHDGFALRRSQAV